MFLNYLFCVIIVFDNPRTEHLLYLSYLEIYRLTPEDEFFTMKHAGSVKHLTNKMELCDEILVFSI